MFVFYFSKPIYLDDLRIIKSVMLYFEGKFAMVIYSIISIILILLLLCISYLVQKLKPSVEKNSLYECGFKPFDFFSFPFDVQFYRVGILFLLFDIEVLFLFPWALNFYIIPILGHVGVFLFLGLLLLGFLYELISDALIWYPRI